MFASTRILLRSSGFLRSIQWRGYSIPEAKEKEVVCVLDSTLRGGELTPGVQMRGDDKLEIAKQLSILGVDICEAGFPGYSKREFEAIKLIAKEVAPHVADRKQKKGMRIAGLATATQGDIEWCYEAIKDAPLHRIHTFVPTSDIYLKQKLRATRTECLNRSYDAVRFAASALGDNGDVQFSCEDAGRTDAEFLLEVLSAVIEAGATTVSVADTVGIKMPNEFGSLFKRLKEEKVFQENKDIILSAHCHDDLGLATANSLEAIQNGARQVVVTCNGIGERAGITCMEEVIMAIHCRPEYFPVRTLIDTRHFNKTSEIVSAITGLTVSANKAVVGKNALYKSQGFARV